MDLNETLRAKLQALEENHLRRLLRPVDAPGACLIDFASNDYLGLRRHPKLMEASHLATTQRGTGAGAARLITGTDSAVLALEETLAAWKEKEASLVFSSGYAAALGAIPALIGKGDTVILDKLAHASLIDAAQLSGATLRVYPHNNLSYLESLLARNSKGGRILMVTESLFSMDGDTAPLRDLVELKERHGAWLLVDEAHATGLYGEKGAGLIAEAGLSERVEIILGTLSKAVGSIGGYIAGSRILIDWLINSARSFIFSTALPPGTIAASQTAVDLIQSSEGAALRENLRKNVRHFCHGLPEDWSRNDRPSGAIQPLLCGEAITALTLSSHLRKEDFFVPAIRYPTVPRRAARLRVTLAAGHEPAQIEALLGVLRRHSPRVSPVDGLDESDVSG